MGRFQLHFAKYMATYTALMFVSFLLWQAAGGGTDQTLNVVLADTFSGTLFAVSDFLIDFAAIAYPLYAVIATCIKRIGRSGGLRRLRVRGHADNAYASASSTAASPQ